MRAKNADWAIEVADSGRAERQRSRDEERYARGGHHDVGDQVGARRVAGRIGEQPRNLAAGKRFQHDTGSLPLDRGHQGTKVLVVVAGLRGDDHRRRRITGEFGETAEFVGGQQVSVVDDDGRGRISAGCGGRDATGTPASRSASRIALSALVFPVPTPPVTSSLIAVGGVAVSKPTAACTAGGGLGVAAGSATARASSAAW